MIVKNNPEIQAYQEALRAHDEDPADPDKLAALEAALKARDEFLAALHPEAPRTQPKAPGQAQAAKHEELSAVELQRVKEALKEAYRRVKKLRQENKDLHAALRENVREKQRYNREIIPALAAEKKILLRGAEG